MLHTDSQQNTQQILGNFEDKNERMFKYVAKVREIVTFLSNLTVRQVAREENKEADELTRLASAVELKQGKKIMLLSVEAKSIEAEEVGAIEGKEDWRREIIQQLQAKESKGYGHIETRKCI